MSAANDANSIYGNISDLSFADILKYGSVRAIDNQLGGTTAPTSANAPQTTAAPNGTGGSTVKVAPNPSQGLQGAMDWVTTHQKELLIGFGGLLVVSLILKKVM